MKTTFAIRKQWKRKIANIKREIRLEKNRDRYRKNPANRVVLGMFLELEAMKKQMSDDIQNEFCLVAQRNIMEVSELGKKMAKEAAEAEQRGLEADYASGIVKRPPIQQVITPIKPTKTSRPDDCGLKIPACYYTIDPSIRMWNEKRLNPDRPWAKKRFEELTSAEKLIIWSLRNRHGIEISQFNKAELSALTHNIPSAS